MRLRRWNYVLVALVGLGWASVALGADRYVVDKSHTSVSFVVRHLVISKVRGKFNNFDATIVLDEHDLAQSSMQGTIQVASIDTDNEKRDNDLRSRNFFDAENYPEITFRSKRIQKNRDGYVLVGDLTIRGVTREIILPFTMTERITYGGKTRFGFEASLQINRQDYGIAYSKLMDNGGLVVSDTVNIEINGEAIQQ